VLLVKGYAIILGLDWLSKFGPMHVDWQSKWVEINSKGKTIKLQVEAEEASLNSCEVVELPEEWRAQNDILIAQF
jgi:hypothetical protein